MDNFGPFTFGGIPDDAEGPEEEDTVPRGWIAPEDRLWRHPSEVSRLEHVLVPATAGWRPTATAGARDVARSPPGRSVPRRWPRPAALVLTLANAPGTGRDA